MNRSMFMNDFFYELAMTVFYYDAKLEVDEGVIYLFLKKRLSSYAGLLSSLLKDGATKVCYRYTCNTPSGKETSKTWYNAITIFVNFDTSIFTDPHATYLFDVPLAKEFWTGREIRLYKDMDIQELKAYLDSLHLEPYCEKIENDIHYCPGYYQNYQKKFDCNGKIMLRNANVDQARFIYNIFQQPVYITETIEGLCKPNTHPITPPTPDLKLMSDIPDFIRIAVYKYSIPPFENLIIYMHRRDKVVVVYPDKSFEAYGIELRKTVIKILDELVKKKYINAYCNEVHTLPSAVKYLGELRKVERCYKWSS